MASLFISSPRHAKSSSSDDDDGLPFSFSSSEDDAEAFRDLKDKQSQERNTSLPSEKKRAKETSKREAISIEKKIESGAKENESGAKTHKEGKSKPYKEKKSMSSKEQEENPSASKRQRSKKQKRASPAPANQVDVGVPRDQLPATATTERVLVEGFLADLKTAVADVIKYSQQISDSYKIEIESIINKRFKSNSEQ